MAELEVITGTVERFVYQSADNEFSVFLLALAYNDTITATGSVPALQVGQEVRLRGTWVFHKKFGKQFEISECLSSLPTTLVGLKKYLGSGLIKGIGMVYADKLVNYFGADILRVIDTQPDRLKEVEGIGATRVERITAAWKEHKEIANLMVFMQEKGISPAYASKIYKHYRHEAIARLQENPYRLADDIWGIGFKTADAIAQKLGFALESPHRITAGITFALTSATTQGHLYVELAALKQKTIELLQLNEETDAALIKQGLHELYAADKIKMVNDNDAHYLTLTSYYFSEVGVARRLKNSIEKPPLDVFDLDTLTRSLAAHNHAHANIILNKTQQEGILACLKNKVTIITGGPGTGKTTLIKQLLAILDAHSIRYKLAAPTGRAAKRMAEGTGRSASTLHRLLEFDVRSMSFTYHESNTLQTDFLIIDEASMIDIFLAHALLKALPVTAHLVLIGDVDQLPSVGAGNFLNDCRAYDGIAQVQLTEIFRQAQDSLIIVNAHRVNKGEFPLSYCPTSRRDFIFIKEDKPEELTTHLKRILFIELPKHGIAREDAIVLVPMNRGTAGAHHLNHELQLLLNPHPSVSVTRAGSVFKAGDKVMQLRNNYDKLVFNGDIGIIESVLLDERILQVQFSERLIDYDFDELHELVLAYAITIHKSQGSEYPAVIIPLFMQHFTLLQRNLVYTAITRAKKLCILIGQSQACAMAIRNATSLKRVTFLYKFLTTLPS